MTEPPIARVRVDESRPGFDPGAWYLDVPAVAQLRRDGLSLDPGVTVLLGENGTGKSTLVEALALGWAQRVGTVNPFLRRTLSDDVADLGRFLAFSGRADPPRGGFFLRAETMHRLYDETASEGRGWGDRQLHTYSHGESFLAILRERFWENGVFFLDEPEAALSFRSSLGLLALLDDLRTEGSQVILATHSPLLAALPAATLLELDDQGIRSTTYDDLDLVRDWREFLAAPPRYLRHLLAD